MTTKEEKAWLAGLLDGEGYIGLTIQKAGSGGRVNNSYRLYVKISMCHEPTVRRVQELLGKGAITTSVPKNPKHRQAWTWWASSRQAIEVLELLKDFVFTKKDELELALEWGRLPLAPRGGSGGGKPVPPEELAERHRLYLALREAKGRL